MARKKDDFASRMTRLEKIVGSLEKEDAPLEESMALYKEGVELVRQCREQLEKAKYEVSVQTATGTHPLDARDQDDSVDGGGEE